MLDFFWLPWAYAALRMDLARPGHGTRDRIELLRALGRVLALAEEQERLYVHATAELAIGLAFADGE